MNQIAAVARFAFSYKGTTTEVPRIGSMPQQSAELVIAYTTPAKTTYNRYGSVLGEGGLYYDWASRTVSGRTTYSVAAQPGFVVIDARDMLRRTRTGYETGGAGCITTSSLPLRDLS